MTNLGNLFDSYGRKARLYPALLTALPAVLTAFAWVPDMLVGERAAALLSFAASCGLLYLLASMSRVAGRREERRLLIQWNGWPTTQLLRHSDSTLSPKTRERYLQFLSSGCPNFVAPNLNEELANPRDTDRIYASAIDWLKEQRRSTDYRLLHHENADYGFRRNMRGLKLSALLLCMGSFALSLGPSLASALERRLPVREFWASFLDSTSLACFGAALFSLSAAIVWIFVVRDDWVRDAADQYAKTLLATCDLPADLHASSS